MKTDFERELDDIFANVDDRAEAEARLALDIASQFAALRLRRGLSQAQVAERLGKSQQAISKIENPGHNGHQLARLKEAVEALDGTLDVTLVPDEELDAYRALRAPKPALNGRSIADPSLSHASQPTATRRRTLGLHGPESGPAWKPSGNGPRRILSHALEQSKVVSMGDYLAKREHREAANG